MGSVPEEWNITKLKQDIFAVTGINLPLEEWVKRPEIDSEDMLELIIKEVDSYIELKNKDVPQELVRLVEKSIVLQTLDQLWKEHIATLDLMRHTIVLRAYGQKDPLNEYKREAFNMFSDMLDLLKEKITVVVCRAVIQQSSEKDIRAQEEARMNQKMEAVHESMNNGVAPENKTAQESAKIERPEWGNVSRNSPCPCGSGKKFKHCHGKVA
jgi:preprotein translocase subunit SecA